MHCRKTPVGTGILAFIAVLNLILSPSVFAEEQQQHDQAHHGHDTSGLELGISTGYVHLDEEGEDALGLHLHLMKRLSDKGIGSRLAVGLGAETIFGVHEHHTAMLSFAAYPWRGLILSVAPGIEWAKHEGDWESEYATHIETAYVFEIGRYDIGPVVSYSTTDHDKHYMIGIHVGLHL